MLQALAAAAEAVQQWEFVQQHGAWVEAHQQDLPAAVVAFWQQAQQVGMRSGMHTGCVAGMWLACVASRSMDSPAGLCSR